MRKMYKVVIAILVATALSVSLFAQNNFFTKVGENRAMETTGQRLIVPDKFYTTSLNVAGLRNYLWSLPSEQNLGSNRGQAPVLELPMPDGSTARFRVWESSVQAPELQAKFPEIRTFLGQGIDDPYATIRFDFNPYFGFSAQILSPNGRIYIDPYARWDVNKYISYYQKDAKRRSPFICSFDENDVPPPTEQAREQAGPCVGTELRTFRLAVACTAEYSAAVGGGAAGPTHAAIVASVNRITGVYEAELAVRMVLVANNNLIEYLANPDPYSNVIGSAELTSNQSNIDLVIGAANYDIGHLFTSDDNGLAQISSVCTGAKARGATGSPNLIGDGFDIDYVAHEMGHQFGAQHSFNTNTCVSPGGSIEPGGGTTIMAYAGICASSENIQPNSDPIFHALSFDQISNFLTSGSGVLCATATPTGNTLPIITSMGTNNLSIPIGTPFTLTATATDANSDALTYNWEGWDIGPASGSWVDAENSTTRPLFRTRVSKTTGSRTFPDPRVIAANYPGTAAPSAMDGLRGEVLPQTARTMKFRLTVRDNRAGGGGVVSGGDGCQSVGVFQVNAVGITPFTVLVPTATGITYPGGSSQTVTWNNASTTAAPFNVANVKISISSDGGLTFPTVLLASTPNDGSEAVTLPANPTTLTTYRIKVEAIGNIFFDISNNNFTITAASAGFTFNNPAPATAACPPPSSMSISLGTTAVGPFSNPITLSVTSMLPTGTTVTFSPNPVTPGGSSTVTLNNTSTLASGSYFVTVQGTATGAANQTRDLTFTVNAGTGPSISGQPQPQTVCAGSNATFNVTSATGISYQWQVNTGTGFANISGATLSSYTANAVTAAQNGHQYRVLVNGQCGQTTSDNALLTVQTPPSISAHPQNATVCLGSNATFNVTAAGTGITYQWQVSTDGGNNYNNAPGASTSSSYTASGVTTVMNNNRYRVIVSGTCPPAATSNAATLTVISPTTVTTQPQNFTICETGTATFTAAGSGTGVLYQWQVSTDGGNNYTNINGETAATLTLNSVTAAMNNNRYRAQLRNATCTTPVPTTGAILTVNARPTVTLAAAPLTQLLPGQTTTITATINPTPTGFNISWFKNDVEIPGVTGTTYNVDVTGIGNYKVKIVNQTTGCNNESAVLAITAEESKKLFVFPSPNDGQFKVSYYNSGGGSSQQTITVYDAHGTQVYSAKMPVSGQYTLHNIDLRGKGSGIYIVVIGDASGKKLAQEKVFIHP